MFDEKSTRWIEIYKGITKVVFWILVAAAVVLCFAGWSEELEWTEVPFFDGILGLVVGGVVAFYFLVSNMLIIQFLNNVQVIRERVESLQKKHDPSYNPKPIAKEKVAEPARNYNEAVKPFNNFTPPTKVDTAPARETVPPASVVACPSCGKTQYPGREKCFSCGAALK